MSFSRPSCFWRLYAVDVTLGVARVHFTSKEILPVRVPSSEQGMERLIDGPVELC